MRILFANDGFGTAGGVDTYLTTTLRGLLGRGHEIALFNFNKREVGDLDGELNSLPRFGVLDDGEDHAFQRIKDWRPQVCYSHNMHNLHLDRRLLSHAPVVKFLHGHFGVCVSAAKMKRLPVRQPCTRSFGPMCLALYFPCACGEMKPRSLVNGYLWARRQKALFGQYSAIVVGSQYMKEQCVTHGAPPSSVFLNPLFTSERVDVDWTPERPDPPVVAFAGRMISSKGGDLLIRAVAHASDALNHPIGMHMAGDGPARQSWEELATRLGIKARFPGWLNGDEIDCLYRNATIIGVPSIAPETFGLVGLEAGWFGVPALGFQVGGISQWLVDGHNGRLVPGSYPSHRAMGSILAEMLADRDRLAVMSQKARQAAEDLSLDAHLNNLEDILGATT